VNKGITWDENTLFEYLENPKKVRKESLTRLMTILTMFYSSTFLVPRWPSLVSRRTRTVTTLLPTSRRRYVFSYFLQIALAKQFVNIDQVNLVTPRDRLFYSSLSFRSIYLHIILAIYEHGSIALVYQ